MTTVQLHAASRQHAAVPSAVARPHARTSPAREAENRASMLFPLRAIASTGGSAGLGGGQNRLPPLE